MAFTVKLQSPAFDRNGTGSEISLPVSVDTFSGSSLAAIVTLFAGDNKIMDFGQLREVITLVGFLSDGAAGDATYREDGTVAAQTVQNAVHWRDIIRRSRSSFQGTAWSEEAASGTWTSANLVSAGEDDSGTDRARGKMRLIFDSYWDEASSAHKNLYVYGTVGDFSFGPRPSSTLRTRIPFKLTFLAGVVVTGT